MSMTKCPNCWAKLIKISKDSYSCTNCGSLFTNGHEVTFSNLQKSTVNNNESISTTNKNDDVIVTTKEQLKEAKERGCKRIIVRGELAKNLAEAQKINTLGPIAMGVLVAALAAIPFTGGLSAAAALPIAAATGLSTTVIIAIIAVGGIVLIVALLKDYTIIIRKDEVILEKKNCKISE